MAEHIDQVLQHDAQVCETQQLLQAKQILLTHDQYLRIEQVIKQPILDTTPTVRAILTYSQDLTPRLDLAYLLALYQRYLAPKQAIQQCLRYLQLETCFYKYPTRRELETLLTLVKVNTSCQVAQRMEIHHRTVEEYKARLRDKLKIELGKVLLTLRAFHEIPSACVGCL